MTQVDAAVECGIVTQMLDKGAIPKVEYDLLPLAPLSSPAESPRLLEVNDKKLLERYVLLVGLPSLLRYSREYSADSLFPFWPTHRGKKICFCYRST